MIKGELAATILGIGTRENVYNRGDGLNKHGLKKIGVLSFIHETSTLLPLSASGSGRNTRK